MLEFQLILMRHAKSSWADSTQADFDRGLNQRGQRSAPRMGQWLREQEFIPDLIHCSSARRTMATCDLVTQQWQQPVPVYKNDSLYLASPETILRIVATDSLDARRVMVIGHNPGMEILAGHFSGACGHFPTAAVAVFNFVLTDWQHLRPGSPCTLVASTRPKMLDDETTG